MLDKSSPEAREMMKQKAVVRKDSRLTAIGVWALVALEFVERVLPTVLEVLKNAVQ